MPRRISVGKRLAEDKSEKRGVDALFNPAPVRQHTSVQAKKFEKGTFYFDPDDLSQLERVWIDLMGQGIRCNKSEIVSILLSAGLEDYEKNTSKSLLRQRLSGKRRRG
ncbi:hypothetical protein ACFLTS_06865 [Chloroflexota bacterium]